MMTFFSLYAAEDELPDFWSPPPSNAMTVTLMNTERERCVSVLVSESVVLLEGKTVFFAKITTVFTKFIGTNLSISIYFRSYGTNVF